MKFIIRMEIETVKKFTTDTIARYIRSVLHIKGIKSIKAEEVKDEVDEMKPCPFCGGDPSGLATDINYAGPTTYHVSCSNRECGLRFSAESKKKMKENWNIRV